MVVTLFRSRLRPEFVHEYRPLASEMLDLARSMPGFRSFKSFTADDGERISIIEFDSLAQLDAWRDHPQHRRAQQLGRERFYSEYHLQVCGEIRAYSFEEGRRRECDVGPLQ
jgi:heme-degrading monooxygenase HmoA